MFSLYRTLKRLVCRPHLNASLMLMVLLVFVLLSWWSTQTRIKNTLHHPPFSVEIGSVHLSVYLFIKALILLVPLLWGVRLCLRTWERKLDHFSRLKENEKSLIMKSIQILFSLFSLLLILDIVGIDLTALTLLGGAVSIGIGFGLQKISANFISGFILLIENAIKKGDYVVLSSDIKGYIRHIHTRHTVIEADTGCHIMVPNAYFITQPITNWTHKNKQGRLCIHFTLQHCAEHPPGTALQKAIESHIITCQYVLTSPAPHCALAQYTQATITGKLCIWVEEITDTLHPVRTQILTQLWEWCQHSPWTFKKLEIDT